MTKRYHVPGTLGVMAASKEEARNIAATRRYVLAGMAIHNRLKNMKPGSKKTINGKKVTKFDDDNYIVGAEHVHRHKAVDLLLGPP